MVKAKLGAVFARARTDALPKFFIFIDTVDTDVTANSTHNIQPAPGQLWSLNYVQIRAQTASGASENMQITLVSGSTEVVLEKKAAPATNDEITFGSFGNGPLILSRTFFLRTYVETSSATAAVFHVAVSVSEV